MVSWKQNFSVERKFLSLSPFCFSVNINSGTTISKEGHLDSKVDYSDGKSNLWESSRI